MRYARTRVIRQVAADEFVVLVRGEQIGGRIVRMNRPRLNDRPGGEVVYQPVGSDGHHTIAARDLAHAGRMLFNHELRLRAERKEGR